MDYEKKYNKLVNAIKVLQETNPSDEGIQNWVNDNVPELRESEDEKYNGKAMLYVLEKGVEQGKREMLDKACKWLRKELVNFEDYSGMGEELISDFRKAMSNETE